MKSSRALLVAAGLLAVVGVGLATYSFWELRQRESALTAMARAQDQLQSRLRELEGQIAQESQRAKAAEDDNAKLLQAIDRAKTSAQQAEIGRAGAVSAPITREGVLMRWNRARELVKSGQYAEALVDLTWCYDEGMVRVASFSGVRGSSVLAELARLAKEYPPANAWLRERRGEAEKRVRASSTDAEAAREFAAMAVYMGHNDQVLALFDQFPSGDERRRNLGNRIYDDLVAARRYKDAAEARSFSSMNVSLSSAGDANPRMRAYVVTTTAKNVEVLAGAGDLERARTLMQRLFAVDNSAETRAVLQKHLERAGQPQLLAATPQP